MADKKVLIFGKQSCAKCTTTKNKVGHYVSKWGLDEQVSVIFVDMDTLDGLSEGAFRDVWEVPTTIVEQKHDILARWDGKVPQSDSLRNSLLG